MVADLVAAVSLGADSAGVEATPQAKLAIAEAESASAECASQAVFRALKAQDHAFLHLDIHRMHSLNRAVL